ncbi:MAG: COR domain-containing protein [Cyclobacteriaceae bacterium]
MTDQAQKLIEECLESQSTYLDLGNCGITDLNELPELFACAHVETLILSNKWFEWKSGSGKFVRKQSRNSGSANRLSSVPLDIKVLTNLTKFICSESWESKNWDIDNISFVQFFPQLKTLNLRNNKIQDLSPLQGLKDLQTLILGFNRIQNLSPLQGLKDLKTLDLRGNQIQDLSSLQELTDLETLNLGFNRIQDKDTLILRCLRNLKMLNLRGNQIQDISVLQSLRQLQTLNLRDNEITDISLEFLKSLPSLSKLRIDGNPIKNVPPYIFDMAENVLEDVRNFLEAKAKGSSINNEVKALLIGNGGVGKTQIALRLSEKEQFQFNPEHDSTHAINLLPCQVKSNLFEEGLRVTLWDSGGQILYHSTHRIFFQTRALSLLVWDLENGDPDPKLQQKRDKNENLTYWLEYANLFGKGNPVLVLQNKMDLSDQKEIPQTDQNSLKKQYPITYFIQLSAKEGTNFKVLENRIRKTVEKVPKLRDELLLELPTAWINIREKIRSELTKENSLKKINWETFRQWCQKEGEAKRVSTILRFFHNTGVLYYQPPYFSGDVILDQAWAIRAIYQVLDRESDYFEIMKANKGSFCYEDICEVWSEYDDQERELFVDFMLSAETCFENTPHELGKKFEDRAYIIPQFIPAAKLDLLKHYIKEYELGLVSETPYGFLPALFIHRFIVKAKNSTEDRWQSGVLIKYKGQYAMVEADYEKSKIVVRYGAGSEELLEVIHNELEAINQNTTIKALKGGLSSKDRYLRGGFEDLTTSELKPTNQKSMKVFLSYNHKDKVTANRIIDVLKKEGYPVFMDDVAMEAGENIESFINKGVRKSRITVLLVSEHSLQSGWVTSEIIKSLYDEKIRGEGERFIPVTITNIYRQEGYVDSALDKIEKKIQRINEKILNRRKQKRGSDEFDSQLARREDQRYYLPKIVKRLIESSTVDISGEKFAKGMKRVLERLESESKKVERNS